MNKQSLQSLGRFSVSVILDIGLPLLAWWIWRPLGAFLAILSIGQIKAPLQKRTFGRSNLATFALSLLSGALMAIFVWFLYTSAAVDATWARVFFCFWGFFAVVYIDIGINGWIYRNTSNLHPLLSVVSYITFLILTWGWPNT